MLENNNVFIVISSPPSQTMHFHIDSSDIGTNESNTNIIKNSL
jgi:hypothetical protein